MPFRIDCDGACEPHNPGGYACWAWVAYRDGSTEYAHRFGCVGHGEGMTNNVAEYHAVLNALRYAYLKGWKGVEIRTDSKLVVEQVNGRWACKAPGLYDLHARCCRGKELCQARLTWIPREQNTHADALSKVAVRMAQQKEATP